MERIKDADKLVPAQPARPCRFPTQRAQLLSGLPKFASRPPYICQKGDGSVASPRLRRECVRNFLMISAAALALTACDVKQAATGGSAATSSAAAISQAAAEKIVADAHASFTGGERVQDSWNFIRLGAVMFDPTHVEPTGDRAIQTKWAAPISWR